MSQDTTVPIHVAAAIFLKDGQLLAFRRAEHKSQSGLWEFPGGKVEDGETEEDALRREISEELQIEIGRIKPLITQTTKVEHIYIKLSCFIAFNRFEELPVSTDHDCVKWVTKEEALLLDWAKPDLPALNLLIEQGLI